VHPEDPKQDGHVVIPLSGYTTDEVNELIGVTVRSVLRNPPKK
jgi:hypothetical protein